jgi:hypothetical protein
MATKIQADCVESHFPYCRAEVDFSRFFLIRGATGLAIYGTNATTSNFRIVGKNIAGKNNETGKKAGSGARRRVRRRLRSGRVHSHSLDGRPHRLPMKRRYGAAESNQSGGKNVRRSHQGAKRRRPGAGLHAGRRASANRVPGRSTADDPLDPPSSRRLADRAAERSGR